MVCHLVLIWSPFDCCLGSTWGSCAPWSPHRSLRPGCSHLRRLLPSAFATAWSFTPEHWRGEGWCLISPLSKRTSVGLEPGTQGTEKTPRTPLGQSMSSQESTLLGQGRVFLGGHGPRPVVCLWEWQGDMYGFPQLGYPSAEANG